MIGCNIAHFFSIFWRAHLNLVIFIQESVTLANFGKTSVYLVAVHLLNALHIVGAIDDVIEPNTWSCSVHVRW